MAPSTVNSSLEFLYSCSEIQENRKKKHEQEEAVQKKIYGSKAQKKNLQKWLIQLNDVRWFYYGFTIITDNLLLLFSYF